MLLFTEIKLKIFSIKNAPRVAVPCDRQQINIKTDLLEVAVFGLFFVVVEYLLNASVDFETLFHQRKATIILVEISTWTP